ncbi:DUF2478 domain-containing protein [Noviherbaspirillum sp.]|uniref:DUF2478 domain-containing protein n=1 Tax=Noviherbaspirillum sp. TaxID=1926288 RepID=UPI002D5B16AE|nr:DUF2478 domain-containing protein [Noviherbaspirillum sp.]HZW21570.1 DUF2478 domain-containing protein [Noviherbaspirillum sp.]
MQASSATTPIPLAALVYRDGIDPAPVLQDVVSLLRQRGVVVGGAVQHGDVGCAMTLELLPSGVRVPISQDLGSGASGCRLDSVALAEAASLVRKAIDASPQLAVFNKFGSQEAVGSGMHAEMVAAVTAGVPILTAVRDTLLPQWEEFTGGQSAQLSCTVEAALAWWDALASD